MYEFITSIRFELCEYLNNCQKKTVLETRFTTRTYTTNTTRTRKHHPKKNMKRNRKKCMKNKGKSHLASVRIVGNKAYNTRRATSYYDDDKVRNDVNLLSYYLKNRKAAESKEEPKVRLESGRCKCNHKSNH